MIKTFHCGQILGFYLVKQKAANKLLRYFNSYLHAVFSCIKTDIPKSMFTIPL